MQAKVPPKAITISRNHSRSKEHNAARTGPNATSNGCHEGLTMGSSFLSVFGTIATVALIAIATRWLSGAKGSQLPKIRDGASVYGIKWQWRAIGFAGGLFAVVMSVWSWHDLHRPEWGLIAVSATVLILSLWLASGSLTTNQNGITKRGLWYSRSFQWKEITEIRLHDKQGGAIELRSGARKVIIDSRFDASRYLLNEIEDRTQLQPIRPGQLSAPPK